MVERSSDQIIKPINLDALTTWVGTYPEVGFYLMSYLDGYLSLDLI